MIRPIITAIIEYLLAFYVFKKGKKYKNIISAVLFFLASYQLGEVLVFLSGGEQYAFKVAYVSTTLLPPLGVLLLSKILNRKIGYIFFQIISFVFVAYLLLTPVIIVQFEIAQFCIRIYEYDPIITKYWFYYYQGTLMFTMIVAMFGIIFYKAESTRNSLKWLMLGYISFNGLTVLIGYINPWFWPSSASLMCALAIIAAFIFTKMSLGGDFFKLHANKRLTDI